MKKISNKYRCHCKSLQEKIRRKELLDSNRKKNSKLRRKIFILTNIEYYKELEVRRNRYRIVYKRKKYNDGLLKVIIDQELGIESKDSIEYFLDTSEKLIDFNSSVVDLHIEDCGRIWPSALTMFCSLVHWVRLTSTPRNRPKLGSTKPNSLEVSNYLDHSGFYDYVNVKKDAREVKHDHSSTVKIEKETKRSNVERREEEIENLLKKHSTMSKDEIEMFSCIVLIELFANVTEHGIVNQDQGWWLLAQYHKKHKFISFCVADNGAGIRHSLMAGPQRFQIKKLITDKDINDGNFIQHAFKENVSGAISASIKTPKMNIIQRHARGARRGNGLNRIRSTCAELSVAFSLLSHNGYIFYDENGNLIENGSRRSKVFAGTMYHFRIKAK